MRENDLEACSGLMCDEKSCLKKSCLRRKLLMISGRNTGVYTGP